MSNKSVLIDKDSEQLTDEKKEQQYVHDVYQAIAPHFSQTRYKPWPVVEQFLKGLDVGSVGADIGCGNGKYLGVNKNDFVISIAVIHHFTTPERRIAAIEELFRIVKQRSHVLIYVWALEQNDARRKFDKEHQDVLVPWVVPASKNNPNRKEEATYNRYYHLFKKGELDDLVLSTGKAQIIKSDYDKDNWYVVAKKNGGSQ
ncbi:1850_t:CDS:2 [Acaulospora colombiana]|uniref:1850_t:CDS:1 n=1 Tax=Acaulospora colombiana TaxID=27376 RepID=A0ACA9MYA3_9GLOM|nr:1850_t:CDS:2 [Acaulospora colombiana]